MSLRLSVLDQSPIVEGRTGGDALRNSIDLARLTELCGYHRYWVAEHHGTPMLACAAPEVLIPAIAAATSRIRVGSGGVMLPHYSPLKVAEAFSMLSALYPNRIDLAVGRAPGSDPVTAFALQRDRRQAAPDDFPQQLTELLAYVWDRLPSDHRFARLAALPGRPERPDVWLLGSSLQSGGEEGVGRAAIEVTNGKGKIEPIADHAVPHPLPHVAEQDSMIDLRRTGEVGGLSLGSEMAEVVEVGVRVEGARRHEITQEPVEQLSVRFRITEAMGLRRRAIVGSPGTVRAALEDVAAEYTADELMIVTITYDHAARCRSYELIAEAFNRT